MLLFNKFISEIISLYQFCHSGLDPESSSDLFDWIPASAGMTYKPSWKTIKITEKF